MLNPEPLRRHSEEHPLRYALIALVTVASLWCFTPRFYYFSRTFGIIAHSVAALVCVASFLWCPRQQWIQKSITGLASFFAILAAFAASATLRP